MLRVAGGRSRASVASCFSARAATGLQRLLILPKHRRSHRSLRTPRNIHPYHPITLPPVCRQDAASVFYRWAAPCCACNNYCRDTLLVSTVVMVGALLPTCAFMAVRGRRRRQAHYWQSPAKFSQELTAWPRVPVSPLQFACLQVGLVIAVLGLLPQVLFLVRHGIEPLSHLSPPSTDG